MNIRGFLIDIDGVISVGDTPIAGAQETISYLEDNSIPFRFLSNTTRKCRKTIAQKLASFGIIVPPEFIITPPVAAIAWLKQRGIDRCSLLVTGDVAGDFLDEGITISEEGAPVIIIGDAGDNFTYQSMRTVFRQVMDGAECIALERDRYWMDKDGLTLGAGPFVAGIEYATGKPAHLLGKPSREFFLLACNSMGLVPEECIMVGDDIHSDIGGAQAAGIRGFLVQTGKYNQDIAAASGIPHTLVSSVADLVSYL